MIAIPSHPDIEVAVLRTVLSRPWLAVAVPDLEVRDFWSMWHQLLWKAIRMVMERLTSPDASDLRMACAMWLESQPGALPDNAYGILASDLYGRTRKREYIEAIAVDVFRPIQQSTPDVTLETELVAAHRLLSYARRARDQMRDQLSGKSTRKRGR